MLKRALVFRISNMVGFPRELRSVLNLGWSWGQVIGKNLCLERTQKGMLSWKVTSISDGCFSIFILNESLSVLDATGYFFLPFNFIFIIYLFNVGCSGSLLLRAGFLYWWWVWATLCYGAWASHCGGISRGAQAPCVQASVAAAWRLSSCGTRA